MLIIIITNNNNHLRTNRNALKSGFCIFQNDLIEKLTIFEKVEILDECLFPN